jgi:xylulokinase
MLAAGVLTPGPVLDSLGTAESLIGVMPYLALGERELASGLSIVPHILPGRFCWLGGMRSAGGSIEWLRGVLSHHRLTYEEGMQLAREAGHEPTGILYLPYLSGSGGVRPDEHVRAAFAGLTASHGRAHLMKAVLEGTAYEAESIRRAAEALTGAVIGELIAVGGGARNLPWMQIKADVSGCGVNRPRIAEATACGAALAAGLRSGALGGIQDVVTIAEQYREAGETTRPDSGRHEEYTRLFENGYEPLGGDLRDLGRRLHTRSGEIPVTVGGWAR